jgi:hypothetical protein
VPQACVKASHDRKRKENTMANDWLILGLSLGISAALTRIVSGEIRKRREAKTLTDEVSTWEGEGGQIPGATPASSVPGTTVKSGPVPHSTVQ